MSGEYRNLRYFRQPVSFFGESPRIQATTHPNYIVTDRLPRRIEAFYKIPEELRARILTGGASDRIYEIDRELEHTEKLAREHLLLNYSNRIYDSDTYFNLKNENRFLKLSKEELYERDEEYRRLLHYEAKEEGFRERIKELKKEKKEVTNLLFSSGDTQEEKLRKLVLLNIVKTKEVSYLPGGDLVVVKEGTDKPKVLYRDDDDTTENLLDEGIPGGQPTYLDTGYITPDEDD
jgi:hypothetical protein